MKDDVLETLNEYLEKHRCSCVMDCNYILTWLIELLQSKSILIKSVHCELTIKQKLVKRFFNRYNFLVTEPFDLELDHIGVQIIDETLLLIIKTIYGNCIIYTTLDSDDKRILFQITGPEEVLKLLNMTVNSLLTFNDIKLITGDPINQRKPFGYRLNEFITSCENVNNTAEEIT